MAFTELQSRFPNFGCAGNGARAKQRCEGGGGGEEGKETLARKPHDSAERSLQAFTLEHTSVA